MKQTFCSSPQTKRAFVAALPILAALSTFSGCKLVQTTASIPGEAVRAVSLTGSEEVQIDPVILQQDIFRFSDEYTNTISAEIDKLTQNRRDFASSGVVRMKLNLNYRLLEIAAGPNDYVNLCDLVCLVVISRHAFEEYWIPQVLKESGRPTSIKLIEFERQIIELAKNSLGKEALAKLNTNISEWLKTSYEPGIALLSRYTGVSSEVAKKTDVHHDEKTSLLSALMIDPLAGLDPTVREIAQTRLFAERAMFVAQRMPKVIRMEGELLSYRLIESPEIDRLLENVNTLTASAERISRVAEGLPTTIRSEREALVKILNEQGPELNRLLAETHATIEATEKAMTATNTVVQTTDRFLERLGVYGNPPSSPEPEAHAPSTPPAPTPAPQPVPVQTAAPSPSPPPPPPGEPFRIQDYTAAAAQLATSADHLNVLILSLDKTLATATSPEVADKVSAASQAAFSSGRDLVDHIFWRVLILGLALCVGITLVVLSCRKLGSRRRISSL